MDRKYQRQSLKEKKGWPNTVLVLHQCDRTLVHEILSQETELEIMTMSNWRKTLAAGALILGVAGLEPAFGSDSGRWFGWGPGHMMRGWNESEPMKGYDRRDFMLDRIDGRLAFLETELKITADQAPAWKQLTDVIRSTAKSHNAGMEAMMDSEIWKRPLPERLAFQQTHLEARLEEVKEMTKAVDDFYTVLSDEQKKVADEIVLPAVGMGMMSNGNGPGRMMR